LATAIAVILVLGVSVGPAPARAQIPPAVPVAVLGSGSEASNYSIQIGTTSYVAPDLEPASGQQPTGGFQILVLDRATLALLSNESFATSFSASSLSCTQQAVLAKYLGSLTSSSTLVIAATIVGPSHFANPKTCGQKASLIDALQGLGASLPSSFAGGPYFLIGIPGVGATHGWQSTVPQTGYLVQDTQKNYTFLSSSFVAVVTRTIDASGNPAVQVGATIYTSPALDAQAQGGYQVVVLAAAQNPLAVASNTSYATNYGGSSSKATCEGQDALNKFLNAQVSPTQLVIVSSIGAPGAVVDLSDCKGSGSLTDSIQALGGTGAALGQNYSLVGYPPGGAVAPEASSMEIAGSSAQLTVVLQPNRGGVFSPVNGDFIGAGTVNYGLYAILAQPPVAWPVPAAGNAEQAAALQYISYVLQCPITLPKTPPTPPASFPRARRVGSRIARTFAPSTAP
jgi:hypothetical protein